MSTGFEINKFVHLNCTCILFVLMNLTHTLVFVSFAPCVKSLKLISVLNKIYTELYWIIMFTS